MEGNTHRGEERRGRKSKWDRGGRSKGMLKIGHCEKNTSGAIIHLPLLKPHNEMVQWNH